MELSSSTSMSSNTRKRKRKPTQIEQSNKNNLINGVDDKLPANLKKIIENNPFKKQLNNNEIETLLVEGYCIIKNVLDDDAIAELLHGNKPQQVKEPLTKKKRQLRERSATQVWKGAIESISKRVITSEGREEVKAPIISRSAGRYDMPLPREVRDKFLTHIDTLLLPLIKYICKNRGALRTQDILLSKSKSDRQPIHTDCSWNLVKKNKNPTPHYYTILIPLVQQTKSVGGTRVWPRTHRKKNVLVSHDPEKSDFFDCIEPLLNKGDALIFDGLLSHCGMENLSGMIDDKPIDRYFYYAAYSKKHDFNVI